MALQIGQGYWPSNVRATDSESECVRRLSASIVVHATVCSSAQCAPSVATSEMTTKILPSRTNTTGLSNVDAPKSRSDRHLVRRQDRKLPSKNGNAPTV